MMISTGDTMHIAVVGAAGRTGSAVVAQAVQRGDQVVAVARRPAALRAALARRSSAEPDDVREADVLDCVSLTKVLVGVDAVVSTVGVGASRAATEVYSTGAANLLAAMSSVGAERLIAVSAAPAGPRAEQPVLDRFLVMPLLDRFFGSSYADMRRMERLLDDGELAWTVLRPPRLLDRAARGNYRWAPRPVPHGRSVTIADLASALLACLHRPDLERQTLYVAN
jgi:putative NADH-flavin reductase